MKYLFLFLFTLNLHAEETLKFNASYTIPTIAGEDEALATFDLIDYTVVKKDKGATLSYQIPEEMTGLDGQVVDMELMIESLPLRVFEGDKATALCRGLWNQMECDVRFKKLDFDIDNLEHVLHMRGLPHDEIEARLIMVERFSGDPIGKSKVK